MKLTIKEVNLIVESLQFRHSDLLLLSNGRPEIEAINMRAQAAEILKLRLKLEQGK